MNRFQALVKTHVFHLWCWCWVTGFRERDDPEGQLEPCYWRDINPIKIWESVLPQYCADIKSPGGLELRLGNIILAPSYEKHFPLLSMVLASALHNKITLPWTTYRDYTDRTVTTIQDTSPLPPLDPALQAHRLHMAGIAADIIW